MLVASQCLHGGIVDYLDRTLECSFKVEPSPPPSKVIRIRNGPIPDDYPRIANRYRVILPIAGEFLDACYHLSGRQLGTGWKFPRLLLSRSENLHVGSAYVDNQHIHRAFMYLARLRKG